MAAGCVECVSPRRKGKNDFANSEFSGYWSNFFLDASLYNEAVTLSILSISPEEIYNSDIFYFIFIRRRLTYYSKFKLIKLKLKDILNELAMWKTFIHSIHLNLHTVNSSDMTVIKNYFT